MAADAAKLQRSCHRCSLTAIESECNFIDAPEDWRQMYVDYLKEGALPMNRRDAEKLKYRARRFFLDQDQLYRRTLEGIPLKCLGSQEGVEALQKVHEMEHQGGSRLHEQMLSAGYYWPTMEEDARMHVKRCQACQKHGNLVHAPAVDLRSLRAPWPFHTWAMDLIGPIHPASHTHQWILAATEVNTKWVEAVPLKSATGENISKFIKDNIICRFGVPKVILSDNGTPFVNKNVRTLLAPYRVVHKTSTPYYPQCNGQAEATNKTLIRIISKLLDENGGAWSEHLTTALWAYRISKRKPTQTSPYMLVYGTEAVLPAELNVPSARIAIAAGMTPEQQMADLEAIDERRERAEERTEKYREALARAYNKKVVPREFKAGDLVWKTVVEVMRDLPLRKFSPRWEGPYRVLEASPSGYCKLARLEDGFKTGPINVKYVKMYYP